MSARWIAPAVTLTTFGGQWLGAVETEANGTTTETGRDPYLWHASEAERNTSIRDDHLVAAERMINYLLFGGKECARP
jgi:hypothetical protein